MNNYQLEEMCKHGFQTPLDCPTCDGKIEERSPSQMVYVSEGGTAYHYVQTCHALEFGQSMVEERGGNAAPIERIAEDTAKLDRSPCRQCKPKKSKNA